MKASVNVINVGYGDSIVVNIESGNHLKWGVIDCHNPNSLDESPTLEFLKKNNVQTLEFICLTHPDYDHYSGIEQLLRYFSTEHRKVNFYYDSLDSTKYTSLLNSKRQEKTLKSLYEFVYELVEKDIILWEQLSYDKILFKDKEFLLTSKGPYQKDLVRYIKRVRKRNLAMTKGEIIVVDKNLLSVISSIEFGESLILLLSDASKENIENFLKRSKKSMRKKKNLYFTFIKVAHHGSSKNNHSGLWKNHTIRDFSNAAISSGSKYEHPNIEVVKDIISNKINLYCTNKSGCLKENSVTSLKSAIKKLDPLIIEGLDQISSTIEDNESFHGTITFETDGKKINIITENSLPPITTI